jgi:hypothetical protein
MFFDPGRLMTAEKVRVKFQKCELKLEGNPEKSSY